MMLFLKSWINKSMGAEKFYLVSLHDAVMKELYSKVKVTQNLYLPATKALIPWVKG